MELFIAKKTKLHWLYKLVVSRGQQRPMKMAQAKGSLVNAGGKEERL